MVLSPHLVKVHARRELAPKVLRETPYFEPGTVVAIETASTRHQAPQSDSENTFMNKQEMTAAILAAKHKQGVSWTGLSETLGMAETFIASSVYGENSMAKGPADKLCKSLGLEPDVAEALAQYPLKGQSLGQTVPTDPLVYRFYEIMQVYGLALKDVIQERFGDGIMSAIDFQIDVAKIEDPKGDRVLVTMNGKFLPYKAW
jgi:cyanate lyase